MENRNGREKEFEELIDRFASYIRGHIMKYGVHRYGLDPDDIAQEVRIKIWKLVHSEKIITNHSSYIRKIVNSSVIDQIRKFRREEGIYNMLKEKQIAEANLATAHDLAHYSNLEQSLHQAIKGLIESRRQVVILYLFNLSIPEIASYLKWSQDKTRNLLYRGLADLRKKLNNTDNNNEK